MSRPRKPTVLKVLNGNPGKRPLNKNEPKPMPIKPSCPSWLNTEAKKMWKALEGELESLGLLTMIDGQSFAAACQSYGVWVECERYLKKHGRVMEIEREGMSSYFQQRPEVSIGNTALKNFKTFCSEFGLTPSARSSIEIPELKYKEDSGMNRFLSG